MIYGGLVFLWACLEVEQRDRTWSKLWVPLAEAGYAVRYTQACSAARSLRAQAEQQPSLWRTALRGEFHPHPPCTYQVLFTVAYFSWPEYFVCFVAAYVALIALILKQTWRAYLRYVAEVGTAAGHYQRTLFRYARGSFECFGCCLLAALCVMLCDYRGAAGFRLAPTRLVSWRCGYPRTRSAHLCQSACSGSTCTPGEGAVFNM
jgi:hypothetical protein